MLFSGDLTSARARNHHAEATKAVRRPWAFLETNFDVESLHARKGSRHSAPQSVPGERRVLRRGAVCRVGGAAPRLPSGGALRIVFDGLLGIGGGDQAAGATREIPSDHALLDLP